jgi:hypothetical protein
MDQLKEFQQSLSKMVKGDMSLVDELGSMQLVRVHNTHAPQTPCLTPLQ